MDAPIRKRYFLNGEPVPATERHAAYLKPAFKLLDQVSEQMRNMNLGQLWQKHTTEDGATLTAIKRHGLAEIRIDLPARAQASKPHPKQDERHPYLWVGARVAWDRMGAEWQGYEVESLLLAVFEPSIDDVPQGIVCNAPVFNYPNTGSGGGFSMVGYADSNPRPAQVIPRWWNDTYLDGAGNPAVVQATQHGLYMTSIMMPSAYTNPFQFFGPEYAAIQQEKYAGARAVFDPKAAPEDVARRPFGLWEETISDPAWAPDGRALWDCVAVLDPYPSIDPVGAARDLNLSEMFDAADIATGAAQVIPGNYVIKIGAVGFCTTAPLQVDLEVRLLKAPHTITKQYQIAVDFGSQLFCNLHPYGHVIPDQYSFCPHESRNNPHTGNWWQGAVLADPRTGKCEQFGLHVPEHGFSPGRFDQAWECPTQSTAEIYIGWAQPFSEPWIDWLAQVTAVCVEDWDRLQPWQSPSNYPITDPAVLAALDATIVAAARDISSSALGLYRYHPPVGSAGPWFEHLPVTGFGLDQSWMDAYQADAFARGVDIFVAHVVGAYSWSESSPTTNGCPDI